MWKALSVTIVCAGIVLGEAQHSGWTDKNKGQTNAPHMLQTTYYERGYMSAHVNIERSGNQDVFVVDPGPVFHFRDVKIVGLTENLSQQVMKDAPKPGEVYSAARVNDWLAQEEKQLETTGTAQKARQEMRLDREAASATVIVSFE